MALTIFTRSHAAPVPKRFNEVIRIMFIFEICPNEFTFPHFKLLKSPEPRRVKSKQNVKIPTQMRHGLAWNFWKKAENTQMYRCVSLHTLVVSGAPELVARKKCILYTSLHFWGVVYQTHLQCNEHTTQGKIGRECIQMSASDGAAERDTDKRAVSERVSGWEKNQVSSTDSCTISYIHLYKRTVFFFVGIVKMLIWAHISSLHFSFLLITPTKRKIKLSRAFRSISIFYFSFAAVYITHQFNDFRNKTKQRMKKTFAGDEADAKRKSEKMICIQQYSFSTDFCHETRATPTLCTVKSVIMLPYQSYDDVNIHLMTKLPHEESTLANGLSVCFRNYILRMQLATMNGRSLHAKFWIPLHV